MTDQIDQAAANEDPASGVLAEAERLLGITGPKFTITVDGRPYRLMSVPVDQPAQATAVYAEMLYLVRHWLSENPAVAAEISEYPLPVDDTIRKLPLAVQMAIFLGLELECYARKNGVRLTDDDIHDDTRDS